MKIFFGIIMVIQTILHYLGIIGIVLGIIAFLYGNTGRGWGLLIGGIGFIVLKYLIGLVVFAIHKKED